MELFRNLSETQDHGSPLTSVSWQDLLKKVILLSILGRMLDWKH